ncbi:MAG: VOC family protein [Bacteroidota bacterium]|jgi:uncharacterized glyoxalase superfamily protein PhnB
MNTNSPIPDNTAKRAESESFSASMFSISLTVKDLGTSLAWYHDVLGFTIDRKIEREGKLRSVALKAGIARISINQDDGAKGWTRIKGEGFSLNLITEQNIDKIANRIKELGGVLDSDPADTTWGARMFRLKDPDGYKLAISSPRPA